MSNRCTAQHFGNTHIHLSWARSRIAHTFRHRDCERCRFARSSFSSVALQDSLRRRAGEGQLHWLLYMPPCAVVSILVILANGLSLCLSEVRWPVVNTRPLARLRLRYSIFDLSAVSTGLVGEGLWKDAWRAAVRIQVSVCTCATPQASRLLAQAGISRSTWLSLHGHISLSAMHGTPSS